MAWPFYGRFNGTYSMWDKRRLVLLDKEVGLSMFLADLECRMTLFGLSLGCTGLS